MTILIKNRGFTLIEVMVAIVIMMVGLLGLLQSINIATEYNLKNHLRDEGVFVGEKYLNELKGSGYDNILPTYPLLSTASKIRGTGKKIYVERSSTSLASDTKLLNIVVKWTYKGVTYENRVSAPISQK
ncbi:MAG: prepilin-type N-terminal cleavage/methylation domain-containing protein [Desulfuromonadaceae bacterium]|nr:prepilin-type N-terminal cleavage/methylation domain-containing protein [Desulfuromonadaceae bacterium]